jgi:hypothetical protein
LPYGVISVTFPHGSLLKPVWRDAADVGNGEVPELAAEIERLVVAALVDHGAFKLFAPEKVEGIDDVCGEVNVSARAVEGVCKLSAGKQRALNDQNVFPAEITVRVSIRGKIGGGFHGVHVSGPIPFPCQSVHCAQAAYAELLDDDRRRFARPALA